MMSEFSLLRSATVFLFLLFSIPLSAQPQKEQPKNEGPKTVRELQVAIEKVLKETGVPAVGLALVEGDSVILATSMGKADVEKNRKADENTMFRIGSVSKMFVSLAILKLQEEGKVSLTAKVRDLAPDVAFTNPWEEQAPILVQHLLEHTTGWDDMHLTEYAMNDPGLTLKKGLDYHPHSRISRWMPGTRMSYCNSGPPVAAYIIEKITGQRFEDYIQEQFFKPMGMKTATYFISDRYKKYGAMLYQDKKPQKYWNISVRPSGAINATPLDMAGMIRFFVHRGRADSLQIISYQSLKRMETSETTIGAKQGLEYGYGLSNYSSAYKSFVYRSHGGGVNGGLTDFSYLPSHAAGYAIMINAGDVNALNRIQYLVRSFQTQNLKSDKTIRKTIPGPAPDMDINGYYIMINPRIQLTNYLQRITNLQHIWSKNQFVFSSPMFGGGVETYEAINDHQFTSKQTGKITMVKAQDPVAGDVLQADTVVLKRISPVLAFGQLIILGLWLAYLAGSIIFGIICLVRYWAGKRSLTANLNIILWPVTASLLFVLASVMASIGGTDPFELLGKISYASVSIMVLTICFALAAVWSTVQMIRMRHTGARQSTYIHMAVLTGLHLIATGYLWWHGVIGLQTWN